MAVELARLSEVVRPPSVTSVRRPGRGGLIRINAAYAVRVILYTARIMLQHRISGLPVVEDDGTPVGMITEGDLLRRAETGTQRRRARWLEFLILPGRLARDYADAHARKIGEVTSTDVVSVRAEDSPETVVRLMERHLIKRVPVVENGPVVGIVSRANRVRALGAGHGQISAARRNFRRTDP